MASLTNYKGLQVITPDPTGAGGLAINDNFKYLADSFQSGRRDSVLSINSTTLVSTDLTFDIKNGETWRFEVNLFATSLNQAADLKCRVNGPGDGYFSFINTEIAVVKSTSLNTQTSSLPVNTSSDDLIQINGIVEATSDGTVDPRISNFSGTTTQTFNEWSYFIAQRIS